MVINIKTAARTHADGIDEVISSCLVADSVKLNSYGEDFAKKCIDDSLFAATLFCDKVVRGICVCDSSPVPDGCEITALYISDGYQSKGLGRKLLSHCLREMRAQRFKTVFLWLDDRNERAARFFAKIGFRADGKQRRMISASEDYAEQRYRIDI